MSRNIKSSAELVTFLFHNIVLDNVPFCHRTLSLKFHFRLNNFPTDPTPVENFLVKWTRVIEMERTISRDSSGKPTPSIVDVTVYTHSVKGSGKEEIAHGKLDLAQIVRRGNGSTSIQLQSNILESVLRFDVEIRGGESFKEVSNESKQVSSTPLPEIHLYTKNSWFNFKHNPDQIEADANILVEAATKSN
ncbi:hypothetical protein GPJ56_000560 [Histomonas meleagridis]|uniref:uncharacterized protein n=1 Tax=Histomonas meleagridis TaxID=135588 RepID=UPI0035597257|nr:hypothetical protein GPJ56_000560 [Histomonas meleagridis]KAH0796400.1 hypothetical protein GO595_010293 [Histomonas meleagridis]